MKKSFLTSVRGAYEPPYAEIIEFAVERGFDLSSGTDPDGFSNNDGTEIPGRDDYQGDSWHS